MLPPNRHFRGILFEDVYLIKISHSGAFTSTPILSQRQYNVQILRFSPNTNATAGT